MWVELTGMYTRKKKDHERKKGGNSGENLVWKFQSWDFWKLSLPFGCSPQGGAMLPSVKAFTVEQC